MFGIIIKVVGAGLHKANSEDIISGFYDSLPFAFLRLIRGSKSLSYDKITDYFFENIHE